MAITAAPYSQKSYGKYFYFNFIFVKNSRKTDASDKK